MNTYFYIRVSPKDQNTIRQEVKAKEYNIPIKNVRIEKASGKSISDRPILNELMDDLKQGDKLIVDSISRFARNTKDLLDLVDKLNKKGVTFISLRSIPHKRKHQQSRNNGGLPSGNKKYESKIKAAGSTIPYRFLFSFMRLFCCQSSLRRCCSSARLCHTWL
jgi:hypothetical protein